MWKTERRNDCAHISRVSSFNCLYHTNLIGASPIIHYTDTRTHRYRHAFIYIYIIHMESWRTGTWEREWTCWEMKWLMENSRLAINLIQLQFKCVEDIEVIWYPHITILFSHIDIHINYYMYNIPNTYIN